MTVIEQKAQLYARLKHQIEATPQRILSFDAFLQTVLYTPHLGYYQRFTTTIGSQGDFTTAPMLSPLFSQVLAHRFSQTLSQFTSPTLLELGAGTGHLALGLIQELNKLLSKPVHYLILEPSASLKKQQHDLLKQHLDQDQFSSVTWIDQLPAKPFCGLILANEVIDAIPFKRFQYQSGQWQEMGVIFNTKQDKFDYQPMERSSISKQTIDDYTAHCGPHSQGQWLEYRPQAVAWLNSLCDSLDQGNIVLIDYGGERHELIHPQRHQGTLRCYHQHQLNVNPFDHLGEQDITADVDFESLIEQAINNGLTLCHFETMAHYLMTEYLDTLLSQGAYQSRSGLKQILLPEHMGDAFKVCHTSKG